MSAPRQAVPAGDRSRERLLAHGPGALSDQELLALLLQPGSREIGAMDLANDLLADQGSLGDLSSAMPEELVAIAGIGPAKAAALVAAFELGRRVDGPVDRVHIRSPEDVVRVARRYLDGQRRERVVLLICDAANRLRRTVVVSEGALDRSLVPIRETLNAVLRHDGRAFALAHNHPSGGSEPSRADQRVTQELNKAANVLGLRFLGHVVVAPGGVWDSINLRGS